MRTRDEKSGEVDLLRDRLQRANSVALADYRGLSVSDAIALRSRLRAVSDGQIEYRVTKNTLLRLAVADTPAAPLESYLVGPTAVAFAFDEPAALAKTLVDYAKENEKFEIKGGMFDGELLDLEGIRALAALPSKDELRSMLMATLLAPMQNLSGTLYALLGNLRNALDQRREQLET
jgi:large subunit ribosomal protein L10